MLTGGMPVTPLRQGEIHWRPKKETKAEKGDRVILFANAPIAETFALRLASRI
jgi:hypothetical protein